MKRLVTTCAVACLMLSFVGVAWAAPVVNPPPGAPAWWNEECEYFAYGWWSADIIGGGSLVSPPDDSPHWGSNFLENTDFTAIVGIESETVSVDLDNVYRQELYKEIYVYITGTTESTVEDVDTALDTDGGVFTGTQTWVIGEGGAWSYVLEGEIHPQPDFVRLTFTVPGMLSVTNIWAGENCIPEPATLSLLALSGLALIRRRRAA